MDLCKEILKSLDVVYFNWHTCTQYWHILLDLVEIVLLCLHHKVFAVHLESLILSSFRSVEGKTTILVIF